MSKCGPCSVVSAKEVVEAEDGTVRPLSLERSASASRTAFTAAWVMSYTCCSVSSAGHDVLSVESIIGTEGGIVFLVALDEQSEFIVSCLWLILVEDGGARRLPEGRLESAGCDFPEGGDIGPL